MSLDKRVVVNEGTRDLITVSGLIRRGSGRDLLSIERFTLGHGERLAIQGPSGSGKSLFLRCIALLDPIAAGQILFEGKPISDAQAPEYRRRVVYLAQHPAMVPGSVRDNLCLPATIVGQQPYAETVMGEWVSSIGRTRSFLDQRASALSGGEAQLVAVLRALAVEPQVLLLDEPTGALDPAATAALEEVLLNWHGDGRRSWGVVWVTHDPAQASRVGPGHCHMAAGRLLPQEGK